MWKMLGLFGVSTVAWWGLLWLVLPQSWQRISPSAILLLHLGPPMLLSAGVKLWGYLKEKRAKQEETEQESAAEAERQSAREAARERHLAELRERQAVVDCRWLWARAVPAHGEPDWLAEAPEGCLWSCLDAADLDADEALEGLRPHVTEALQELYAVAPGAAWLPLVMEVVPSLSGIEQIAAVKEWQTVAMAETLDDGEWPTPEARFLAGAGTGTVADRARQLLQQQPELPGVIMLGADAPLLTRGGEERDESDPATAERLRWLGKPGLAVAVMLFLREQLPEPDLGPVAVAEGADPYQPYWEKDFSRAGGSWGVVPARHQAGLAELPVLAQLGQSSAAAAPQERALQLTRQLQPVLDNALVNAALLDYPFSPEDAKPENDKAASLGWLVHNGGDVDAGGVRLAAIASALNRHAVELHPIDEASNLAREWGDVGVAADAMLAAAAVSHSARLAAPALITQFSNDHVALAMARPPREEATA
ncbi:hypothetical protein [Chromobacterium sp. Beijing]|uniref:hypothetical protein n=1 Tax=Chromobacterium sp. Beijing TaxID=2735795 RepID=UPI001F42082E|nr:hypothetical protein [Chromobacterium sp. Beijing]UJB32199.1 hypothetical protein HQN78_14710 [Chromobacterium sp. Beijing]